MLVTLEGIATLLIVVELKNAALPISTTALPFNSDGIFISLPDPEYPVIVT